MQQFADADDAELLFPGLAKPIAGGEEQSGPNKERAEP